MPRRGRSPTCGGSTTTPASPTTRRRWPPRARSTSLDHIVFGTDWPYAALPERGDPAPDLDVLGTEHRSAVEFANAAELVPRLLSAIGGA